jgi:hypothetical protein
VGIKRRVEEGKAPSVEAWRRAYVAAYGTTELKKSSEEGHGIRLKHYN